MRGRELKLPCLCRRWTLPDDAPYAGARIETIMNLQTTLTQTMPLMRGRELKRYFSYYIIFFLNSSASGNHIDENRARTNFHLSVSAEGAPVCKQKELRKQRKVP